jgi:hypothetical protein
MEQNVQFRNRLTDILAIDFQHRCNGDSMKKSFQSCENRWTVIAKKSILIYTSPHKHEFTQNGSWTKMQHLKL